MFDSEIEIVTCKISKRKNDNDCHYSEPRSGKVTFLNELRPLIASIANHRNHCNNLLSSLEQTLRSDVTFHSVESSKELLDEMKLTSETLRKMHSVLKKRAQARMKKV